MESANTIIISAHSAANNSSCCAAKVSIGTREAIGTSLELRGLNPPVVVGQRSLIERSFWGSHVDSPISIRCPPPRFEVCCTFISASIFLKYDQNCPRERFQTRKFLASDAGYRGNPYSFHTTNCGSRCQPDKYQIKGRNPESGSAFRPAVPRLPGRRWERPEAGAAGPLEKRRLR